MLGEKNIENPKNTGRTFVQIYFLSLFIFYYWQSFLCNGFYTVSIHYAKCFDQGGNILMQHMHDICALC